MKNLYLIGGGGHCRSVIDVVEAQDEFDILGIFDNELPKGTKVNGYEIIGCDEDIIKTISENNYFLITIGQIKSANARVNIDNLLLKTGAKLATVISPRAHVSKHATLETGIIIMHDALVNSNSKIGKNCIINSKALIEHDAIIEPFCHISTGAIVNGSSIIRKQSFIGSNATVCNNSEVPPFSVIPAGSFFKKNINSKLP